ncbi:cation transporter, partial [Streptomyces sp. NPDC127084]|uniref:cation transporter n=1 Tax=Streptomyces sp. NPDC127084 TaxID=3347133 RepID=UPI00364EBED6
MSGLPGGHQQDESAAPSKERSTAVLDVRGLDWASQQGTVESVLGRRPGVLDVEVNPVAQAATVVFDPRRTSLARLRRWVTECGYHCAGQVVPSHICDAMAEPDPPGLPSGAPIAVVEPGAHALPEPQPEVSAASEEPPPADEETGHVGHADMSMAGMAADLRNRFLVAALFSVPIVIWSPIGEEVFGLRAPVPFGLRQDVWALLLSLPVIFYSCAIFFGGALRALRARTLDMMVLVAVAV